uniref:Uncharacterized protein n=1 Tax=Setaria italica TaxID=4555 RepID=K3YF44_SETIT
MRQRPNVYHDFHHLFSCRRDQSKLKVQHQASTSS